MGTKIVEIPGGCLAEMADYKKQDIPEYQNHCLIEALPKIKSKVEVVEELTVYPEYDPKERLLDPEYRIHAIQRIFRFFQPLIDHLDLEQRFAVLIRQGYVGRNPSDRQTIMQFYETERQLIEKYLYPTSSTAAGFTLIGISGCGKTTSFQRILSQYPQVIIHETPYNIYQIPWIKLDCPKTLKGLCINFFLEVDRLLGTNYKKYGSQRYSVDSMLAHMVQVAKLHYLGVLVIDEVQNLKGNSSETILDFFVTLVNTIGLPVCLIGTMKAVAVLQREFRQARRGSGQGDKIWRKMEKNADWDLLINGMWKFQWTRKEIPLTEEIKEVLYEESQGIIDIAIKLYAFSQRKAIFTGRETISVSLIKKVAKENLQLVQPMLKALKSGNEKQIRKYEDLYLQNRSKDDFVQGLSPDLPAFLKQAQEEKLSKQISKVEEIIFVLLKMGLDVVNANRVAQEVLKSEDLSIPEAIKKAVEVVSKVEPSNVNIVSKLPKRNQSNAGIKKSRIVKSVSSSLGAIVIKGRELKQSAHDSLTTAGYIKSPFFDFKM